MTISKSALLEIHDLQSEARRLSATGSKQDSKTVDVLLSQINTIKTTGFSSDELRAQYTEALLDKHRGSAVALRARHEAAFRKMILARNEGQTHVAEEEYRDIDAVAGSQSLVYTEGPSGGFGVPFTFYEKVVMALAQTDPLLSDANVNLITEPGYAMRPKSIAGYDLTTVSAQRTGENTDPQSYTFPISCGVQLNGYIYLIALRASFELEMDDFESFSNTAARAFGVGFARGIGVDVVTGTGSGEPSGLSTAAINSGYTTGANGIITATDISDIYFAVNRVYRNSPKCAWVLADSTYQLIRNAKDSNNRPLLNMVDDFETLMGKKVLVSPSMPSGAGSKGIVFGDLSYFNVRLSQMWFKRSFEAANTVEFGRADYIGRMRADSQLLDPATQSSPLNSQAAPLQYATLHS